MIAWVVRTVRARAQGDDRGLTLPELLISMVLVAIVSMVMTAGFVAASKATTVGQDESEGLGDMRTVSDRISRDIQNARAVTCDGAAWDPTCASHLQLWIDYNSNYKIDPTTEIVTWQLQLMPDGVHYEVTRTVGGVTQVIATSLIVQVAFTYNQQPTATSTSPTQTVTTAMTYDAIVGRGTTARSISFTARLRNVT
jgi:prepilin-type N-terminal cleavage/methylation domain-containing protein